MVAWNSSCFQALFLFHEIWQRTEPDSNPILVSIFYGIKKAWITADQGLIKEFSDLKHGHLVHPGEILQNRENLAP